MIDAETIISCEKKTLIGLRLKCSRCQGREAIDHPVPGVEVSMNRLEKSDRVEYR
jgi:hypothetical protein